MTAEQGEWFAKFLGLFPFREQEIKYINVVDMKPYYMTCVLHSLMLFIVVFCVL